MTLKNIIKSSSSDAITIARRTLVKKRIVEAQEEARQILADATAIARETKERATREAAERREHAYREGRAEATQEFAKTIAAAFEKRDTALREVEIDVLKLSIKLAEKIIGRELKSDKQAIADIVAAALRNVRQQERLIIRVAPGDFAQVEEFKSTLSHAGRAAFLDFEPDPKITAGGCIIESEVGTVDARLETQLKILERALLRQFEAEEN